MTEREKYNKYCEMYNKIEPYAEQITKHLEDKGLKIYCVFLTIGDELTNTYQVDIEYGGTPETYKRIYGFMTEEKLIKRFGLV